LRLEDEEEGGQEAEEFTGGGSLGFLDWLAESSSSSGEESATEVFRLPLRKKSEPEGNLFGQCEFVAVC
jgi:hypothetical protein